MLRTILREFILEYPLSKYDANLSGAPRIRGNRCQVDAIGAAGAQLESNRLNDTPQIKSYPRATPPSSGRAASSSPSLRSPSLRWMVSAILSDASPRSVSSQFESTLLRLPRTISAAAATRCITFAERFSRCYC